MEFDTDVGFLSQSADHLAHLTGVKTSSSIGEANTRGSGFLGLASKASEKIRSRPRGVLCSDAEVVKMISGQFADFGKSLPDPGFILPPYSLVEGTGWKREMKPIRSSRSGGKEVGSGGSPPGKNLAGEPIRGDRADMFDLAFTHGRDAHLDFGNPDRSQLTGNRHLLGKRKGDSGGLFAVPQSGIDQVVHSLVFDEIRFADFAVFDGIENFVDEFFGGLLVEAALRIIDDDGAAGAHV